MLNFSVRTVKIIQKLGKQSAIDNKVAVSKGVEVGTLDTCDVKMQLAANELKMR